MAKKVERMKTEEAKGIGKVVEVSLRRHGVRDFILVASSGDGVAIAGFGCTHCMIQSLAGAILSNVDLRRLVCEALALAMSQEEERPILLN